VEPSSRPMIDISDEISFGAMVPLQVYESLRHADNLSLVRTLLVGGGELHSMIRIPLKKMGRPVVYESFAMTETYTHFALKRINGESPDEEFSVMEGVKVLQDDRGCLVVDVPGVTQGRVVTNDLVEISGNGKEFSWLGRYDNLISTGGIKIVPELLEQRIEQILGLHCLVLSESDARLGQRLVLMIESDDEAKDPLALENVLRTRLSAHEIPKRIVTISSIPRNAAFKPDRRAAAKLM